MDRLSRRRLLATAGAGITAGLAGCNLPTEGQGEGPAVDDCTGTLSGTVSDDRTLSCESYDVTGDVVVASGATLTVKAGATLAFAAGTGLTVEPGGSLVAEGTEGARVTFTGSEKRPGAWRGIAYDAPGKGVGDLELRHVEVRYAGGGSGAETPASVAIRSTAENGTVSIRNALVRDGAGWGVRFGEGVRVDAFESNRITGNGAGPIASSAATVTDVAASNELVGNEVDALAVTGGRLSGSHTWRNLGVPIRVRSTPTVAGTLSVATGTTVEFARDQALYVTGSGSLSASGSGDAPVTFTGTEKRPGHWAGLWFDNADGKKNALSNAVVEYGGGISPDFRQYPGNLVAGTDAPDANVRVDVTNCVLRESSSNGFSFGPGTAVGAFANTEVTGCGTAPGRVTAVNAGGLASSSTYAGNRNDRVVVEGTTSAPQDAVIERGVPEGTATTWAGLDVPYLVEDSLRVRGSLTFAPGSVARFAPGTSVRVDGPGKVAAAGKSDARVTLTADDGSPGGWTGVQAADGGTATFAHAVLERGGGQAMTVAEDAATLATGRTADDAASPTVSLQNATVRKSGGNGISLGRGTKLARMTGCRVVENEGAPVSVHASMLRSLNPDTTFRDNGVGAVVVRGGEGALVAEGESYTLQRMGAAYRFQGDVIVRGHLRIQPDTVVQFGRNAALRVLRPGTLTAEGKPQERVILRGVEETAGYWRGVQVHSTTATFEHAEILHGGGGRPFPTAEYSACVAVTAENFQRKPTLNLSTVRISHSDAYAVFIDHFATVNPEDVRVGLARKATNAESLDHDPHVIGRDGTHDED